MARIDKLLEKMAKGQAESAYLHGDEPATIAYKERKATGAVIPTEQLRSILHEIIPPDLLSKLERQSKITFSYDSPHGKFDVDIFKSEKTLTAYVSPVELEKEQKTNPFEEDWSEFVLTPTHSKPSARIQQPATFPKSGVVQSPHVQASNVIFLDDSELIRDSTPQQYPKKPEVNSTAAPPKDNSDDESYVMYWGWALVSIFIGYATISPIWKQGGLAGKSDFAALIIFGPLMLWGIWSLLVRIQRLFESQ